MTEPDVEGIADMMLEVPTLPHLPCSSQLPHYVPLTWLAGGCWEWCGRDAGAALRGL